MHQSQKFSRITLVALTLAAWLSISNHCAIGALLAGQINSASAEMHCHGEQPTPAKSGDDEMPCCKVLRATMMSHAKFGTAANNIFVPIQKSLFAELIVADEARLHLARLELDTGPPFAVSFAEAVLQRSLPAHAPPSLA